MIWRILKGLVFEKSLGLEDIGIINIGIDIALIDIFPF